ncbi:MAG: ABC transporter permease subunit [Candidatus Thorarchaeota archaeon]
MVDDILTVMWKERKGLFRFRGSRARFLLTMMSPVLLAIGFPLTFGRDWVNSFLSVGVAVLVPVILGAITVPESFAGERERHTLGTLLASRLTDRAILLGKFAVAVAFAWGVTLMFLLLSLIAVNLRLGGDELLLYRPRMVLADLAFSFVMATLTAGVGVLASMRSATVQEAAQTLMAIFLVPLMLVQFGLLLFRKQIISYLESVTGTEPLLISLAVLAVVDGAVFAVAVTRFRRARLILA